jgi:hypothetical protein
VRPWIESVSARATIRTIRWVNILKVLPFILEHARILEAGTVFQPCEITAEHAGPASLQTAHKDILAVILIAILHDSALSLFYFSHTLQRRMATSACGLNRIRRYAVDLAEQDQHHRKYQMVTEQADDNRKRSEGLIDR